MKEITYTYNKKGGLILALLFQVESSGILDKKMKHNDTEDYNQRW